MSHTEQYVHSMTPAQKIDRLYELREQKRQIDAELKDIVDEMEQLQSDVLTWLAEQGLDKASAGLATATISRQTFANVKDWSAFHAWVGENAAFHMLERRVAQGAFREMNAAGEEIPGVEPYEKISLSLRKR